MNPQVATPQKSRINYYASMGLISKEEQLPKQQTLQKAVCDAFCINEEVLFMKTRKREIVNARHCFSYVASEKFELGPSLTAKLINISRKHSTVLNSCSKFLDYYDTEAQYMDMANIVLQAFERGEIEKPLL